MGCLRQLTYFNVVWRPISDYFTNFVTKGNTYRKMMKYLRYIFVAAILLIGGAASAYGSENLNENIAPETQSTSVKAVSHAIEITVADERSHDATIYALTGQIVKHLALPEGTTRIELNPGYYIIRIDGQSKRVVVK